MRTKHPQSISLRLVTPLFCLVLFCSFAQGQDGGLEIPDGYVHTKNLKYFDLETQSTEGTLERIIETYNKNVVGKVQGINTRANDASGLVDQNGDLMDLGMHIDIIHPEAPGPPRPLFFVFATQEERNLSRFQPFQRIFAQRGYVTAVIDHGYNPCRVYFGTFEQKNLETLTGVKAYTAAIRFFRANAEKYSIDPERIGGIGHSKGAYAVTRLSDPKITETSREHASNAAAAGPQPNLGFDSHIQVGYQAMGNGTRRSGEYVTDDYAPTITVVGKFDPKDHWGDWPNVVKAYSVDHDANWLGIDMVEAGHQMATGFQADKGYVREEAVEKFMSRYLEPDLPPAVLYITPYNGREDENPVNAVDPVVIHFSPVMDAGSVTGGKVLVIRKKNQQPVKGTWEIKRKGTYFIFRPELGSFKGRDYLVRLPESVKRSNGVPLDSPIEYSFYIPGNDDTEDDVYGITLIR